MFDLSALVKILDSPHVPFLLLSNVTKESSSFWANQHEIIVIICRFSLFFFILCFGQSECSFLKCPKGVENNKKNAHKCVYLKKSSLQTNSGVFD